MKAKRNGKDDKKREKMEKTMKEEEEEEDVEEEVEEDVEEEVEDEDEEEVFSYDIDVYMSSFQTGGTEVFSARQRERLTILDNILGNLLASSQKRKLSVDVSNVEGETPLHFCCRGAASVEVLRVLLRTGASIYNSSNCGSTPVSLVKQTHPERKDDLINMMKKLFVDHLRSETWCLGEGGGTKETIVEEDAEKTSDGEGNSVVISGRARNKKEKKEKEMKESGEWEVARLRPPVNHRVSIMFNIGDTEV